MHLNIDTSNQKHHSEETLRFIDINNTKDAKEDRKSYTHRKAQREQSIHSSLIKSQDRNTLKEAC